MPERFITNFHVAPSGLAARQATIVGDVTMADGTEVPVKMHVNEARRLREDLTRALDVYAEMEAASGVRR